MRFSSIPFWICTTHNMITLFALKNQNTYPSGHFFSVYKGYDSNNNLSNHNEGDNNGILCKERNINDYNSHVSKLT